MPKAPILTELGGNFVGVRDPDVGRPFVIEVQKGEAGRFVVVGLHFSPVLAPDPLKSDALRKVSVSRLEAAVVRQRVIGGSFEILAEMSALKAGEPIPRPRAKVGKVGQDGGQTLEGAIRYFAEHLEREPQEKRPRRRSLRLAVPTSQRFPDAFYERLAEAYLDAASWSRSPVEALAKANERPYKTVAAWVREARRRGKLPPGRAGKAG